MKRKVCLFTSTRADWGLLQRLATKIRASEKLELSLLVSGSHLSMDLGRTLSEIETAGFTADVCVNILDGDDSPYGICKTMGRALAGYGEALENLNPDVLLVLGDRYETFCVAAAAQILRIPMAHIHGGETTEGAVDEAFRHSITKMAHVHFAACEAYRERIIRLGEQPDHVLNVGALGVENIHETGRLPFDEWVHTLEEPIRKPFFLVTYHPVTLEKSTSETQVETLLEAFDEFPEYSILITKANADTDGHKINRRIDAYAAANPQRCLVVKSLGMRRYLSAVHDCVAVVGNSSSGMLESPILGVPTVNIGDRQKGRIRVPSILDCAAERESISNTLRRALQPGFKQIIADQKHPCDQPGTTDAIVNTLESISLDHILKKSFYDGKEGLL